MEGMPVPAAGEAAPTAPPQPTRTRSIPFEEWERFLRDVSGKCQTLALRVEIENVPEFGAATAVQSRPLIEIETDLKMGRPQIVLVAGDTAGPTPVAIRHTIQDPVDLEVEEDAAGRILGMRFVSADGTRTVVTLGALEPPLPEGESGLDAAMEALQSTP